jgi:hypothetical protein
MLAVTDFLRWMRAILLSLTKPLCQAGHDGVSIGLSSLDWGGRQLYLARQELAAICHQLNVRFMTTAV